MRTDDIISHHLIVLFHLIGKKQERKETTSSRNAKAFSAEDFNSDLQQSKLCTTPAAIIDVLVSLHKETFLLFLYKNYDVRERSTSKDRNVSNRPKFERVNVIYA